MRLIDADALTKKFTNANASGINLALDRYAVKCIEDAPTIAQSEIVHCQDCKYGEFPAHNVRCSEFYGAGCYNGFCAWGEKKQK